MQQKSLCKTLCWSHPIAQFMVHGPFVFCPLLPSPHLLLRNITTAITPCLWNAELLPLLLSWFTFTGSSTPPHTLVMMSGVSRSLPPTRRMPHGVWCPSRSKFTAISLNLCIAASYKQADDQHFFVFYMVPLNCSAIHSTTPSRTQKVHTRKVLKLIAGLKSFLWYTV